MVNNVLRRSIQMRKKRLQKIRNSLSKKNAFDNQKALNLDRSGEIVLK